MKKINFLMVMLFLCLNTFGQRNFIRRGNTFIESKVSVDTSYVERTSYTFIDRDGNTHIIYLDSEGKAFIYRINKRNCVHKEYLPNIGREINPDAYRKREDDNKQ